MSRNLRYLLSVILGIIITAIFNAFGFIQDGVQQFIAVTAIIVLMYICIDIFLWVAGKASNGKKQKEPEVCDTTDN